MADRYWVSGGNSLWASTTNWSATSGGASGQSAPTSADNVFFDGNSGSSAITVPAAINFNNLTTTSAGMRLSSGTTVNCYGSISFGATSYTGFTSTNTVNFLATSAATLTFNGKSFGGPVVFNGSGSWQMQDAGFFTNVTLTAGTLDLNGKTLTCVNFLSTNANARTLAFGTGNIICGYTGVGGTNWTTATITGLVVTGTPVVNVNNPGAVATTVATGAGTEAQAISFNFTQGTYALTFLNAANYIAKNVNFTGFGGSWAARTVASTIYGSLTLSTGMTFAASSGVLTFGATSGTQIITTNGKTVDEPLTVNGVGGTVQLADALTLGATRPLTLTNGTFDGNSKTISGAASFTMTTGSVTMKGVSTSLAFTHTSGTLTQGGNNSTGAYTLTSGTLDLGGSSYTLTVTLFVTAAGTKDLTFNGGTLKVTNATTTAFNNAAPTGFTTTAGTGTGKISMTAATAKTFVGGDSTYNCTLSNDGAGALTISGSNTFTTIANGVQPTAFTFTAATTQTVTDWTVSGTAGNLVTIISSTAGVPALLSKASGTVSSDYLSLKDSTALGGATWYAGANSTNVSGNLGWIFTAPPVVTAGGNFFFMF